MAKLSEELGKAVQKVDFYFVSLTFNCLQVFCSFVSAGKSVSIIVCGNIQLWHSVGRNAEIFTSAQGSS